ncbi:MAG TPA: hypothetical protein VF789_22080 [Thermoanaerobaculia bacterium]
MKRAEIQVALLITLVVIMLHAVRLHYAGALWRDEAGAVEIARLPTLGEIHARFPHEAFPLVFPCTLRSYIALAGGGDFTLRLFGMLIGIAIVGALWLNARAAGGVPLVSLALLGFHPYFLVFGDSLRGYGLGVLLILLTLGAFSRLVARPARSTAAVAALLALLSVHCLLHNSAMLLGIATAAAAVGAVRGRWRLTAAALGIGFLAALSLLPYRGPLTTARQWDMLLTQEIAARKILYRSLDALAAPHRLTAWIWLLLLVAAVVMTIRARAAAEPGAAGDPAAADARLFHLLVIPAAMAAQYGFFTVLRYTPRPWYLLPVIALTASALDSLFILAERSPASRRIRLAIPALMGVVALPGTVQEATVRMTNVDLVTRKLAREVQPRDLVLVDQWFYGVSFNRYYRGPAVWMTLPDLSDHRFHRYDLVKARMTARDPLQGVLDAIQSTLRNGHAVWWITGRDVSLVNPLPVRLPPAPYAASGWSDVPYYRSWTWQVEDFLNRHARLKTAPLFIDPGQPVSRYESLTIRRFQSPDRFLTSRRSVSAGNREAASRSPWRPVSPAWPASP